MTRTRQTAAESSGQPADSDARPWPAPNGSPTPEPDAERTHGGDIATDQPAPTFGGKLATFNYAPAPSTGRAATKGAPVLRPRAPGRIVKAEPSPSPSPSRQPASGASSPRKKPRRRRETGYAPPSKYAHLSPLADALGPGLICVFVGNNPGVRTAQTGHAYSHPSNLFWKLLHSSGCTPRLCRPAEDGDLPRLFRLGNTNIVGRPTRDASELSKQEMADGTPVLEAKIRRDRPEAVCIVGKGIWEAVWRHRYGRNPRKDEFHYGWQDDAENMGRTDDWAGAHVFVATSTSGLSASTRPAEKQAIWRPLGEFVMRQREERERAGEGPTESIVKTEPIVKTEDDSLE